MTVEEEWKSVLGWDGIYEVSNLGGLRSVDREVAFYNQFGICYRKFYGKVLKCSPGKNGYRQVHLRDTVERARTDNLQSLVAEAFIGPRPDGMEIIFRDGDKKNCEASNLYYATHKERGENTTATGRSAKGEASGNASLTEAEIREIRALKGHVTQPWLAEMYGVSPDNISAVHRRLTWKHVQ